MLALLFLWWVVVSNTVLAAYLTSRSKLLEPFRQAAEHVVLLYKGSVAPVVAFQDVALYGLTCFVCHSFWFALLFTVLLCGWSAWPLVGGVWVAAVGLAGLVFDETL